MEGGVQSVTCCMLPPGIWPCKGEGRQLSTHKELPQGLARQRCAHGKDLRMYVKGVSCATQGNGA